MTEFIKMHGFGNDFLIFDERYSPFSFSNKQIQLICNRRFGIGCDQMIVIDKSQEADIFMRIFNADGEEVSACGNATRCVAWLMGIGLNKANVTVQTRNRILECFIYDKNNVTINMLKPSFTLEGMDTDLSRDSLSESLKTALLSVYTDLLDDKDSKKNSEFQLKDFDDQLYSMSIAVSSNQIGFTDVGNPHCTFFFKKSDLLVDPVKEDVKDKFDSDDNYNAYLENYNNFSLINDVSIETISEIGSFIENLTTYFPNKINVGFCHIINKNKVELRVWERGVGETLSCGTGACAAVASGINLGYLNQSVEVINPGSVAKIRKKPSFLRIEWDRNETGNLFMSGEVNLVGRVEIDESLLD